MSTDKKIIQYRKVTAIVNSEKLEDVEEALQAIKVSGISVSQVRGYGEYHNFYCPDMMCSHARIEVFCPLSEADAIAQCIMNAAHTGISGDGMIAVLPVEHFYCIRTKSEPVSHEAC